MWRLFFAKDAVREVLVKRLVFERKNSQYEIAMCTTHTKTKNGLLSFLVWMIASLLIGAIGFAGMISLIRENGLLIVSCLVLYYLVGRMVARHFVILSAELRESVVFYPLLFGIFAAMIYWSAVVSPVRGALGKPS